MTGWNGLRHGCSYEAFILFYMMKKGKLWMRVGNSFQGAFMWNLIDLNLINLNEFQFALFQDHNPLTTKSRPDVHFRRLEFLFLLINALQLLLLKPGVLLVFSRWFSKLVPWRRDMVLFWHLFCEYVASAEFWLFIYWIFMSISPILPILYLRDKFFCIYFQKVVTEKHIYIPWKRLMAPSSAKQCGHWEKSETDNAEPRGNTSSY